MEREDDFVAKGIELSRGQAIMALKRGAGPHAATVAALTNMSHLLLTAAIMDIIAGGMTRKEAIHKMETAGSDLVATCIKSARLSVMAADIPSLLHEFNEQHKGSPFTLKDGWDE